MKAYTSFWPDVEVELTPEDYTDLSRAGLIVEKPATKTENPPINPSADGNTAKATEIK